MSSKHAMPGPAQIRDFFAGKRILVTGGVGSVGREIAGKLAELSPRLIRIIDNNESGLFDMESQRGQSGHKTAWEFLHVDVTHQIELERAFSGIDYCFHCAALKHVPSCERSPYGAINVNVNALSSLIHVAKQRGLKRVSFTSSDKAVNPPNVMGSTKLLGERLVTAANFMLDTEDPETIFTSTRFGNVAGSRGSVIPLFVEQIRQGGPVTVTDERMTRFVMTLGDASDLVIESMVHALPGDVFITKMPALKIIDLAHVMIDVLAPVFGHRPRDIAIKMIGTRIAEKMWEELSNEEESTHILESDRFLCVMPALVKRKPQEMAHYDRIGLKRSNAVYNSAKQPAMSKTEIAEFLLKPGVLDAGVRAKAHLYAPPSARGAITAAE
jgi:FlaA1/EpsC-like NDP-sugar epimerase